MWGQDSKFLILRLLRAQCIIIGYFGSFLHRVCQEYTTKRENVF